MYKENMTCFIGEAGLSPAHRGHAKWLQKKVTSLSNQVRVFSRELSRETNPSERSKLKKWIGESRTELRRLYYHWTHSEMRRRLLEHGYLTIVKRQDKILHDANVEKRVNTSDIEAKYRLAGRIIARNRARAKL